mmetsp:Transcript_85786/g.251171  ORF Transcript_85786/g.251171 Transcript_85786/m.251171 type:complete len:245 (+) Transcript_85786:41-775(+)
MARQWVPERSTLTPWNTTAKTPLPSPPTSTPMAVRAASAIAAIAWSGSRGPMGRQRSSPHAQHPAPRDPSGGRDGRPWRRRRGGRVRVGGARQRHAVRAARHRGQLRRGGGAHRHVPRGHREDADAGLAGAAQRGRGSGAGAAGAGVPGPHAGLHRDRGRLRPRARRLLQCIRVLLGKAPGPGRRCAPAPARGRVRGRGHAGARPGPHAPRRGEAAPAAGTPRRSSGLCLVSVATGRLPRWALP